VSLGPKRYKDKELNGKLPPAIQKRFSSSLCQGVIRMLSMSAFGQKRSFSDWAILIPQKGNNMPYRQFLSGLKHVWDNQSKLFKFLTAVEILMIVIVVGGILFYGVFE
jgi:hypothetical protein